MSAEGNPTVEEARAGVLERMWYGDSPDTTGYEIDNEALDALIEAVRREERERVVAVLLAKQTGVTSSLPGQVDWAAPYRERGELCPSAYVCTAWVVDAWGGAIRDGQAEIVPEEAEA